MTASCAVFMLPCTGASVLQMGHETVYCCFLLPMVAPVRLGIWVDPVDSLVVVRHRDVGCVVRVLTIRD